MTIFSLRRVSQRLLTLFSGLPEDVWHHVIRCQNSNAWYDGNRNDGNHLSVVIRLSQPQPGTDSVREMYQFVCKNSCPSGMNRRPIEVLFTLENVNCDILGRRVLSVRVCSCPKRDKEKEEKEHLNKSQVSNGKKRKLNNDTKKVQTSVEAPSDTKEYVLNVCFILLNFVLYNNHSYFCSS